jgi:transposase
MSGPMGVKKMFELRTLVDATGNVSKACEEMGISRSYYYKWTRLHGKPGKEGPVALRLHPQTVAAPIRKWILDLALEFPDWGSDRISYYLKLKKHSVSSTTVQKILNRNGLGRKRQRESGRIRMTP